MKDGYFAVWATNVSFDRESEYSIEYISMTPLLETIRRIKTGWMANPQVTEVTEVTVTSIVVAYVAESGMWRGFVVPYDLTYEAETKEKVLEVLHDMIVSYRAALDKYNRPAHLSEVPLSFEEDQKKWSVVGLDIVNRLREKVDTISAPHYYAEAQFPA